MRGVSRGVIDTRRIDIWHGGFVPRRIVVGKTWCYHYCSVMMMMKKKIAVDHKRSMPRQYVGMKLNIDRQHLVYQMGILHYYRRHHCRCCCCWVHRLSVEREVLVGVPLRDRSCVEEAALEAAAAAAADDDDDAVGSS